MLTEAVRHSTCPEEASGILLSITEGSAWQAHTCTPVISPRTEATEAAASHQLVCGSSPGASGDPSGVTPSWHQARLLSCALTPRTLSLQEGKGFTLLSWPAQDVGDTHTLHTQPLLCQGHGTSTPHHTAPHHTTLHHTTQP